MTIEKWGSIFFALAVVHTFFVSYFMAWSRRFPANSWIRSVLHLLGEVELVFGFWAALFFCFYAARDGVAHLIDYQSSLNFTEALFVFVIMVIAATQPVLITCRHLIAFLSQRLRRITKTSETTTDLFVVLSLGPLAGSLITEPAAMTVTALLLRAMIEKYSLRLMYAMVGVLFVNISIGGTLTPYAAPPILMIAKAWNWDLHYTLTHLGWRSVLGVLTNSFLFVFFFRKEVGPGFYSLKESIQRVESLRVQVPWGLTVLHFSFLMLVVVTAHHPTLFMFLFLLFVGLFTVTKKYQSPLRIKESLLVGFFLAGLVAFGPLQKWWLQPLLMSLTEEQLFFGATFLTAITDNAALTYLGSQVTGLSDMAKYALVAGAVAGGGLTVIANAPNPAGYSLLADKFPGHIIKPLGLLTGALVPTLVAVLCLWYLF